MVTPLRCLTAKQRGRVNRKATRVIVLSYFAPAGCSQLRNVFIFHGFNLYWCRCVRAVFPPDLPVCVRVCAGTTRPLRTGLRNTPCDRPSERTFDFVMWPRPLSSANNSSLLTFRGGIIKFFLSALWWWSRAEDWAFLDRPVPGSEMVLA